MGSRAAHTAVERAYEAIRGGIFSGDHPAGSRLREEELAERIGVSRTPVREALRRLDAEGLVEFMPNRGAHVASWSEDDLREIFGLRACSRASARGWPPSASTVRRWRPCVSCATPWTAPWPAGTRTGSSMWPS
jgi:DNA-binding transcriptional MocR family regulator